MRKERVRLDLNLCLEGAAGAHTGLALADIKAFGSRLESIHKEIAEERARGLHGFRDLPADRATLKQVEGYARSMRGKIEDLVVIGIGGSSLGVRALVNALAHPLHNLLPAEDRRGAPRIHFVENPDPSSVRAVCDVINPSRTLVNVITKSGSTAETIAGFMSIYEHLQAAVGDAARSQVVATTDPEAGDLRALARREGWQTFSIPPGVGGRFSVLTPVGLLPAALLGIDVETLLEGARDLEEEVTATTDPLHHPAYALALVPFLMDQLKEIRTTVLMPYSDRLDQLGDWFRQLWAESLGKKLSTSGDVVNLGPLPIKSLGAVDQHSQLQLYMEGPNDKLFIFVEVRDHGRNQDMPELFSDLSSFAYLGSKSLGSLLNAERQATEYQLATSGRASVTLKVPEVSPNFVGELMHVMMIATSVAGKLFDVNPYDQPGVEGGKVATYALMEREGYREKRTDILEKIPRDSKLVF